MSQKLVHNIIYEPMWPRKVIFLQLNIRLSLMKQFVTAMNVIAHERQSIGRILKQTGTGGLTKFQTCLMVSLEITKNKLQNTSSRYRN